jgi:hypothetical protein
VEVLSKDLERVIEQVNKLKEENKHLLRRAEGAESEAREKEHHMKKEVSELKVLVVKLEGHIEGHAGTDQGFGEGESGVEETEQHRQLGCVVL